MISTAMMDNPPTENIDSHGLRERLTGIVRELIEPRPQDDQPVPADRQLSELGVKSLGMLRLVLAIEAEFDLLFSQSEFTPENFRCVSSIQALLERLLPARSARLNGSGGMDRLV